MVNTIWMLKRVLENSFGQMDVSTLAFGKMVSRTEKEFMYQEMVANEREYG